MQISILSGIYSDSAGNFRTAMPLNQCPVPINNGISQGYLKPAHGISAFATVAGIDRGGINWNGVHYRVVGTSLVSISPVGAVTTIGTIPGAGPVTFSYSFDYLSVSGDRKMWLYDGATLTQITDPDLGVVLSHIWVDGYFMTTDGEFLVVTELNDPFSVNPLKYGSSEIDPDQVVALLKPRNEPHAVNRYTIEPFENVGASGFPFQRITGASIKRGAVGTFACCVYMDAIAFVGGGINEPLGVYIGANGESAKISTAEVDRYLAEERSPADIEVESIILDGRNLLYVHLTNITLVYDAESSQFFKERVWYRLTSAILGEGKYRGRHHVFVDGDYYVGDTNTAKVGKVTEDIATHFGDAYGWEVTTPIMYNEARSAVIHELELIALTGRDNGEGTVFTTYSHDGLVWSAEKPCLTGLHGELNKRISWLQCGMIRQYRIQRFRGTSDAKISIARLEARVEPLNV